MAIELLESFLFNTYQFLASVKVPGFDVSFIQLFFGIAGAVMSIGFLTMFFGLGTPGFSIGSITSSLRGGNNKNIKISKERKGDER